MPGQYSSQGTTVTFNGVNIGYLTDHDVNCKVGTLFETTNVTSTVVGTGASARVVKSFDATSIELPEISIQFWGPPSYAATDVGMKATIVFDSPGNYLSGNAILTAWSYTGRVGQWSRGTATFQLTG